VAQERLEFSGLSWTARGEWKVGELLGQPAVMVRNAILTLDDASFGNGTIEFDVAGTGHRSFLGAAFRVQEGGSYEDFYLRPHQSGRFDALQYTPVWHNASAWQLYPEHNAPYTIARDEWLHVRLVATHYRLEVYLGEADEPALEVDRLRGPDATGGLMLKAFFPGAGQAPGFYPNAFSNFRFAPGAPYEHRPLEQAEAEPGVITRWAISQTFPATGETIEDYPTQLVASAKWKSISTEPNGRANLAIREGIPEGQRLGMKLARVIVTSDRDRDVKLSYGFSDKASVFLNDRPIASNDNTYRSRSQRYLGVMTLDNDSLNLSLEQGDNELLFAITEAFGGWGLIARLEAVEGLEWSASDG
jgi:hypothetical protein